MDPKQFMELQALPYRVKRTWAIAKAKEFYDYFDGKVACSVGGLDSMVLITLIRKYVNEDVVGVSVSALEDKSIQRIHQQMPNMVLLKPYKSMSQVIKDHGFPVISKEKAGKIQMLQRPTDKNACVRNAIITGDTGEYGGWRKGTRMRLPQKWLNLFAGPENEKYGTNYKTAPFRVSPDCCYHMKEKPADDWFKANKFKPFMGLMASEGGQRQKALMKHGCNYFGKTVQRSCPFAIFERDDLLRLAVELEVPVPEIYGEIKEKPDGTLYTTLAQRTGCNMCGFGIHIEKRPHRFDRLRRQNPQEWKFWMYDMGWGEVLDYIGIGWKNHFEEREQLHQMMLGI
jgi:3'-phosphoadenosine 5'-phosphosulfate sulfotransferase (PAPS reductase)/FAD synthetase